MRLRLNLNTFEYMQKPINCGITRREFVGTGLAALLSGALIHLTGCQGATGPELAADGSLAGSVGDNHMHDAVISKAVLEEGRGFTLHIQGYSDHDHIIEISAAELADIRKGRPFAKRSSTDLGHPHMVYFNRPERD